jgi:DNA-binding LacI/PurR family transcriptional regulator
MPPRRRTTARDVAVRLGVSTKTVANAYSRPDQLSAELRTRILSTADELGYTGPNPLAGRLRRGRVGAIGIAYDNALSYAFEDPAAVALLAGAAGVLEPAGASLLLVAGSSDPVTSVAAASGALVDALIICSVSQDDPFLHAALARGLPTVVVDQPVPAPRTPGGEAGPVVPWVGIDDATAAADAAAHLLALGHRRFAVVSFPMTASAGAGFAGVSAQARTPYQVTRQRLLGYRTALAAAGLNWTDVPVAHGVRSTPEGGHAAAALILARTPRPTALLCMSDRLAEGAYQAAAQRGLSVPRDLSIVGFDDAPPADRLGLTTVANPQRAKGEHAARAVLQLLEGHSAPAPTRLPTHLVIRNSTAAPRRDDPPTQTGGPR